MDLEGDCSGIVDDEPNTKFKDSITLLSIRDERRKYPFPPGTYTSSILSWDLPNYNLPELSLLPPGISQGEIQEKIHTLSLPQVRKPYKSN